jgi:CheY-like chemotaxis protein
MSKEPSKLSIILFDDDAEFAEDTAALLRDYLVRDLSRERELEVIVVNRPNKAIDAISMAAKDSVLLTDLQVEDRYPFEVWERADEQGTKIALYSNLAVEDDERVKRIARQFKMYPLTKTESISTVVNYIQKEFPRYFKKESELKDTDFGEGKRK